MKVQSTKKGFQISIGGIIEVTPTILQNVTHNADVCGSTQCLCRDTPRRSRWASMWFVHSPGYSPTVLAPTLKYTLRARLFFFFLAQVCQPIPWAMQDNESNFFFLMMHLSLFGRVVDEPTSIRAQIVLLFFLFSQLCCSAFRYRAIDITIAPNVGKRDE